MPAAEGTREVSIRELSPERGCPAFACSRVPAIDDCSVELVDVRTRSGCRRILGCLGKAQRLAWKLGLCKAKLARWHEVVGRLTRSGRRETVGCEIGRKRV